MITGMNCLLSVLYPITIADFTIAHVTDQSMNGVLSSFPSKFNSKVGKASVGVYNLCAGIFYLSIKTKMQILFYSRLFRNVLCQLISYVLATCWLNGSSILPRLLSSVSLSSCGLPWLLAR
jgi:hypothetical protein